jgi:TorA maturation chaperone TorD
VSTGAEPVPAAVRQAVYGLLARAFAEPPTEADLSRLAAADLEEVLTALTPDPAPASLRQRADAAPPDAAEQAAARQEFHTLFKVPGGQYLAPYESVFPGMQEVEGKTVFGRLCGPLALEVQQWYRLAALDNHRG